MYLSLNCVLNFENSPVAVKGQQKPKLQNSQRYDTKLFMRNGFPVKEDSEKGKSNLPFFTFTSKSGSLGG